MHLQDRQRILIKSEEEGEFLSFIYTLFGANSLNNCGYSVQRTVIGPHSTGVYAHTFVLTLVLIVMKLDYSE